MQVILAGLIQSDGILRPNISNEDKKKEMVLGVLSPSELVKTLFAYSSTGSFSSSEISPFFMRRNLFSAKGRLSAITRCSSLSPSNHMAFKTSFTDICLARISAHLSYSAVFNSLISFTVSLECSMAIATRRKKDFPSNQQRKNR